MVWFLEYYWVSFFVLLAIVGYGKYNTSVRYTKSTLDDANARKPASAEFINDATLYAKKKGCEAQFHQLLKRINKDFDGEVKVGHIRWIFHSIEAGETNPKHIPTF